MARSARDAVDNSADIGTNEVGPSVSSILGADDRQEMNKNNNRFEDRKEEDILPRSSVRPHEEDPVTADEIRARWLGNVDVPHQAPHSLRLNRVNHNRVWVNKDTVPQGVKSF